MKDVLCLAIFAAKVLCLVAFVNMLGPDRINPAQADATRIDGIDTYYRSDLFDQ